MTTFNIGLNNNPHNVSQILDRLDSLVGDIHIDYRIADGQYNGEHEPTLVVVYDDETMTERALEYLTMWMEQECIAYKRNGEGCMVFNPVMLETFEFDNQYFIEL
jgi:hypothetical protein